MDNEKQSAQPESGDGRFAMDHVRELAGNIGARPSTGEGERRAGDYIFKVMREIGARRNAKVEMQEFRSIRSGWRPFAIASALTLIAEAVFLFAPRDIQKVVPPFIVFILVLVVLQLLFIRNPLTWFLPRGSSRNALMRLVPFGGTARRRIIITSHYDTHRTPLAYSSPGWFRLFKILSPLGMAAYLALVALQIAALGTVDNPTRELMLRLATLIPATVHLLVLTLAIQADLTPYTPGANDNASGVGAMLELADRLSDFPCQSSEVWFVATGCEEVGLSGMQAFLRRHESDLRHGASVPLIINIDNVGGRDCGPCYLTFEKVLAKYRSDENLLKFAADVARQRPDLNAYSRPFHGAYTDGAMGIKSGIPTITFLGLSREGVIPNLHQMTDIVENVDERSLDRVVDFIEELVRKIDATG